MRQLVTLLLMVPVTFLTIKYGSIWITVCALFLYLGFYAARHCKAETGSYRSFFEGAAYVFGWGACTGALVFTAIHLPQWFR